MSSDNRGVAEAANESTRSSALPSHPVMFNDSDMDEASRSVSPEPLTQIKAAAKHKPSEGTSTSSGLFAACFIWSNLHSTKQYLLQELYVLQVLRPPCIPTPAVAAILRVTQQMAYHQC